VVFLSRPSTLSVILSLLSTILVAVSLTMAGIPIVWMVWYRVSPETSSVLAQVLRRPVVDFNRVLVEEGAVG